MTEVGELVESARAGDQAAWDRLVERFSGLVWSVTRAHRLGLADAADVSQTTWLRLVEHLGRLREPDRVGAWLATTARHESLRLARRADRERPTVDSALDDVAGPAGTPPETGLLRGERQVALWRALNGVSARCQALLRTLMADPPPSYAEVSAALELPIGSIGPTRARCLEALRHHVEMAGITGEPSGSFP